MKFVCSVISVKDINRSKKFYQELFDLKVESDYGINIAFEGGIALQQEFDWLLGIEKSDIVEKSNNFELCFETEDFEGFLEKLKRFSDIVYLHDVRLHDWGQHVIRFYDLDENIIEVGESMDSVIKKILKEGLSVEETAKISQHPIDYVKHLQREI